MNVEEMLTKQSEIVNRLGLGRSLMMAEIITMSSKDLGWTKQQLIEFLEMFLEQGKACLEMQNRINN